MKIEELAATYSGKIYKEIQGDVPYTSLSDYKRGMLDCIDPHVEDAYIAGANAVLNEIENILSLGYNTMATVDLIVEKVKELKEEQL